MPGLSKMSLCALGNPVKMAELKPDATSALLAAIIDSSDDAIVSKTLEGVITSWNRGAEKMFGYSAAEAIGQSIRLIIPLERHAEEDDVLAHIRRGEKIDHFETVRQAKDGRKVDISLTVSPVKDAQGQIIGASKVARDITLRKRAHEDRERLAAIVDSSDDAIVSKTLEGIITSWNHGAEKIFGYSAAEAIGQHITFIIPPSVIRKKMTSWRISVAGKRSIISRPSGKRRTGGE